MDRAPERITEQCRFCGAQGVVWTDLDPAPGVCPDCMNERLGAVMQEALLLMGSVDTQAEFVGWMGTQLAERVGLTPKAIRQFVSGDRSAFRAAITEIERRSDSETAETGR